MINAAELLDTALWALTTQSMGAAIDVIERGLEAAEARERERIAAWVENNVAPVKKARALAAAIRQGNLDL